MPNKINSEIKNQIIEEYKKGIPLKEIAFKYSVHRCSIRNCVKDLDIPKRKISVNKTLIDKMFFLYNQGKTNLEIAESCNTDGNLIARYLKQHYGVADTAAYRRQKIKHNPFADLTNNSVQYWLGYLCSDGNIKKHGNEIRLVTNKDIDYLKTNFTNFVHRTNTTLVENKPLSIYKYKDNRYNSTSLTISFSSKEVKEYLIKLGITPNKSLTLKVKFPITYAFLRGVLDGDGHVPKTGRSCRWHTASKLFANQISDFLVSENIRHSVKIKKSLKQNDFYTISVLSKSITKLYDNLYNDAIYYLERKRCRFNLK